MEKLYIVDTTLRDGEQTAGVAFSLEEKIKIALKLNEIGVDIIEVGIPAMGEEEETVMKNLLNLNLNSKIMSWNRIVEEDIIKSINCGIKFIHISAPVSDVHIEKKLKKDRNWVIEKMVNCVKLAKDMDCEVSVGGEDSSRADESFLIKYYLAAQEAGASRVRFADTLGALDPLITYEKIKKLKKKLKIDIDFHGHNDFGMATGNAFSAFKGGAKYISCSVNGLGERAGNTPLEEILAGAKYILGIKKEYKLEKLKELSEFVEKTSGKYIQEWKPIVGKSVFSHESGIHVDGILKDESTYELFNPQDLGRKREIVIGKHTGTSAIISVYKDLGYNLMNEQAKEIVKIIRKESNSNKNFDAQKFLENVTILEK